MRAVDIDARCRCRNGLDEKVAVAAINVEAVSPHVRFANEGASKSDAEMAADLKCPIIVWEDVRGGRDERTYLCKRLCSSLVGLSLIIIKNKGS